MVGMTRMPSPDAPPVRSERPAPVDARRALGRYGEELVARYLRDLGWRIIARNWRCEYGEVDIVARDGSDLVVVEVKTRRGTGFGEAVDAVGWDKAVRLRRLALAAARELVPDHCGLRVDVVGVLRPAFFCLLFSQCGNLSRSFQGCRDWWLCAVWTGPWSRWRRTSPRGSRISP